MFFSRRLSLANTIALCRALRHGLAAGLTLVQVFRQQAERGPVGVRPLAGRVRTTLEQGHGLTDALEAEKRALPPLFFALVSMGEETGHLAETFGELEKHFLLQDKLRKQFRAQSMMPILQLGLAFLILGGVIFVLGLIPGSIIKGLFGLSGTLGAVVFLLLTFGSVGLTVLVIGLVWKWGRREAAIDAVLLRLPIIGSCLEAVTMGRLTMALHLTLDSGLPIARGLRLSLKATDSARFIRQTDTVVQALKEGNSLLEAFTRSGLFTIDFLSVVEVGEVGGRLPEVMRQQAEYWNEEASSRLKTATRLAGSLVWLVYVGFMVWAIFSLAAVYFGAIGI